MSNVRGTSHAFRASRISSRYQSGYAHEGRNSTSWGLGTSEYFVLVAIICFFFEGSVRKWILPVNHWMTYPCVMSKEIAIFLAIITSNNRRAMVSLTTFRDYLLKLPLFFVVSGCFLGALQEISPAGALLTVRSLVVLPIAACYAWKIINPRVIQPSIALIFICAAVNAVLSWIQFYSSPFDWINCYVGGTLEGVATTGYSENVRATGTFSYITGLGFGAVLCVGVGLFALEFQTEKIYRIMGAATAVCGILMVLATVSRGPFLFILGLLCLYMLISRYKLLLFGAMLLIVLFVLIQGDQLENLTMFELLSATYKRAMTADSAWERILQPFYDLSIEIYERPFGQGLGMGQTAARRFGAEGVVETEFARIVYEIGAFGLIGFALTYGGAAFYLLVNTLRLRSGYPRLLVFACFLVCAMLIYGGVAFNHISSLLFWLTFVSGCIVIEIGSVRRKPRASLSQLVSKQPPMALPH